MDSHQPEPWSESLTQTEHNDWIKHLRSEKKNYKWIKHTFKIHMNKISIYFQIKIRKKDKKDSTSSTSLCISI